MPPDQPQHMSPGRPVPPSLPQNAVGNAAPNVLGPQIPNDPLLNLGKRIQELGVLPPTFMGAPTAAPQQVTPPVPFALGYQEEDRPYTSRPDFSKHKEALKSYPRTKEQLGTAETVVRVADPIVDVAEEVASNVIDPVPIKRAIETGEWEEILFAIASIILPGNAKIRRAIQFSRAARRRKRDEGEIREAERDGQTVIREGKKINIQHAKSRFQKGGDVIVKGAGGGTASVKTARRLSKKIAGKGNIREVGRGEGQLYHRHDSQRRGGHVFEYGKPKKN